jgi:hypothetical protein
MRGNSHVRFGGRAEETDPPKGGHRASARPNWGRIARADIWLIYDGQHWQVRGRLGGDGGREVNYQFDQEWTARAMVDRMMKAAAGNWRDLTAALHQQMRHRRGE